MSGVGFVAAEQKVEAGLTERGSLVYILCAVLLLSLVSGIAVASANQSPDATFDYSPSTPSPDETVTFDASGSSDPDGEITEYRWYIDGAYEGRSTGPNFEHSFDTGGNYEVELVVVDDSGAESRHTETVTVDNTPPDPSYSYSPSPPSPDETVTFDASGSSDPDGEIIEYRWYIDGAYEGRSTGPNFEHSFDTGGDYEVKLTVEDNGDVEQSITKTVTIDNTAPIAEFEYSPAPPNPDQRVAFDASGSNDPDGEITEYRWYIDGAYEGRSTGPSFEHSFNRKGEYQVKLVVTDNGGVETSTTQSVTVKNIRPSADFTVSTRGLSPDQQFVLDASGSGDPDGSLERYEWYINGSSIGEGRRLETAIDTEGTYSVELVVTDKGGKQARVTKSVTVTNIAPNATFTVGEPVPVVGSPVPFNATNSSDPDGDVVRYQWSVDGRSSGAGPIFQTTFSEAGYRNITLRVDDNGAKSGVVTREIYVTAEPTPRVEIETPVATGRPVRFAGSASDDADGRIVTYEWSFSNGVRASGAKPEVEFDTTGNHELQLTVTDDRGASATLNKSFVVYPAPQAAMQLNRTEVHRGDRIHYNGTAELKDVVYAWDFTGEGTIDTERQNGTFRISETGDREVTLNVTSSAGVTDRVVRELTVEPALATSATVSNTTIAPGNRTTVTYVLQNRRSLPVTANVSLDLPDSGTVWQVDGARLAGTSSLASMKISPGETRRITVEVNMADPGDYTLGGMVEYRYPDGASFSKSLPARDIQVGLNPPTPTNASARQNDSATVTSTDGSGFGPLLALVAFMAALLAAAGRRTR